MKPSEIFEEQYYKDISDNYIATTKASLERYFWLGYNACNNLSTGGKE